MIPTGEHDFEEHLLEVLQQALLAVVQAEVAEAGQVFVKDLIEGGDQVLGAGMRGDQCLVDPCRQDVFISREHLDHIVVMQVKGPAIDAGFLAEGGHRDVFDGFGLQ